MNFRKGIGKAAGHARAVLQGDAVDSRFFKQHFFATAFAVIVCMAFIAARFDHATTEANIRSLNTQIDVARTMKQQELSRYHTLTRESAMQHLVDSLHLGLTVPEASPESRPGVLVLEP